MSEIKVNLDGSRLQITYRGAGREDSISADVERLEYQKANVTDFLIEKEEEKFRLLFCADYEQKKPTPDKAYVMVWTNNKYVKYGYVKKSKVYTDFIRLFYDVSRVGLSHKYFTMRAKAYVILRSPDVSTCDVKLSIDPHNMIDANFLVSRRQPTKKEKLLRGYFRRYKMPLTGLFREETRITNTIKFVVTVNGEVLPHFNIVYERRKIEKPKQYFVPIKSVFTKGQAVCLRQTAQGELTIIHREIREPEKKFSYFLKENKLVSFCMYHLGRACMRAGKKKVNLFYEKYAAKAEEGAFELFRLARQATDTECYYVIDENAPDYQRIKDEPGIVKKFSWRYYWLYYRANAFIGTDAPAGHLNLMQSNNVYIRRVGTERLFVFLQHGVTYLKRHGAASAYLVGKEAEPDYMVVGSEKESAICESMLGLPPERLINAGLPIFDTIPYGKISSDSPDKVVIMLTWKKSDENIPDFDQTRYKKNVMEVFDIVSRHADRENIIIAPHPKLLERIETVPWGDLVWKRPLSEALGMAKLLITDYSSTCYNSFYQGGGVIFYQSDLAEYEEESGTLIPEDDEYIGMRLFQPRELEEALDRVIRDGRVLLPEVRNAEFEKRYAQINEFHDGKNNERIFRALKERNIL